jgi:hypothetical protein
MPAPVQNNNIPAASETVTVASKLPFGLTIQACEMVDTWNNEEKRLVPVARRLPRTFIVHGIENPMKIPRRDSSAVMRDGYALTPNVPADLWNAWFKDNRESDIIVNHVVFAMPKFADAEVEAKNNAKMARSGLEPLNPDKVIRNGQRIPADPRIPHKIDPSQGPMA